MLQRALLTALIMTTLAACGAASSPTPPPTSTSEATPEATAPIPVAIDAGMVAFEVSGDVALSADPARASYQYLEAVERQQLLIQDANGTYLLLFILPKNPEVGTHPLEASGREYDEEGVYVAAFTPALANEEGMFGANIEGTLTLDAVGDRTSGSFQFSAENANGQKVSVSGAFTDVPLIYG